MIAFFVVATLSSSDVIEFTTTTFKESVLQTEDTYFVMLHTKKCPACHQALPAVEELATSMKRIGIKVGTILIDTYPEIGKLYKTNAVPKFLLFRPKMAPLECRSERSLIAMASFITLNQLGGKQISILNNDERVESFFNPTNSSSRMLLIAKKSTVNPVFKQICHKHKDTHACGFISYSHPTFELVESHLKEIGPFDVDSVDFPALFFLTVGDQKSLTQYRGELDYEQLDAYLKTNIKEHEEQEPAETQGQLEEIQIPSAIRLISFLPQYSMDDVLARLTSDLPMSRSEFYRSIAAIFAVDNSSLRSSIMASMVRMHEYSINYQFALLNSEQITEFCSITLRSNQSVNCTPLVKSFMSLLTSTLWICRDDKVEDLPIQVASKKAWVIDTLYREVLLPAEPFWTDLKQQEALIALLFAIFQITETHQPTLEFFTRLQLNVPFVSLLSLSSELNHKSYSFSDFLWMFEHWAPAGCPSFKRGAQAFRLIREEGVFDWITQRRDFFRENEIDADIRDEIDETMCVLGWNVSDDPPAG
ncbi:hypothetical protein BLNAU_15408 [Blattamonas nauphoetae]|uniref:Thioredoxin domain-containing protein n=1 Tax=Blattamonas nauphoetae TaxID=2049346 RepID=A0ABQ9XAU8_9EUKA|nr:hypothetical protein BLNAU_15408 [Blattamonas nauphoetae]